MRLIGKPFAQFSPEEYHTHIKSFIKDSPSTSKEVQGVSITQKGKRLTVKVLRDSKALSREEVTLLATEYKLDEQELLKLLKKRKIGVIYEPNDPRSESDETQHKKNAKPRSKRREALPPNQLQQPELAPDLHEEIQIRPS
jgi:hypothetical protein